MAYNIRRYEDFLRISQSKSAYRSSISVGDNVVDNISTSLQLVGENFNDYSQFIYENFVWILENFAGDLPPRNAVKGQLWFRTFTNNNPGQFYLYSYPTKAHIEAGTDPSDAGDSSIIANWTDITGVLNQSISDHLAATDNPHKITKTDVGLNNIQSSIGGVFDRNLNLADVPNKSTGRHNLEIHNAMDVYTQAEADALFLVNGSTAFDSNSLGGVLAADYIQVSSPVISTGINANTLGTTTSDSVITGTDYTLIADQGDLSLLAGMNSSAVISATSNSGVSIESDTSASSAEFTVSLHDSLGLIENDLSLNSNNLYINGNEVFHTGNIPTPAEISAVAIGSTSANSALLNNAASDINGTADTIVKRTSAGNVIATSILSTRTTVEVPGANANYVFKTPTNEWKYVSKDTIRNMTGLDEEQHSTMEKASGAFYPSIMALMSSSTVTNATVQKLAVGQYRVTFNTPYITSNYCPIVGQTSNETLSAFNSTTGSLSLTQIWIPDTSIATTGFDIHVKEITNTVINRSGVQVNEYTSDYADVDRVSFMVYRV